MIGRWLRGIFGTDDLLEEIRAERAKTMELMAQMSRTAEAQAMAVNGMIAVIDKVYRSYETDGSPPEGRHINEEIEDQILNEIYYGTDE